MKFSSLQLTIHAAQRGLDQYSFIASVQLPSRLECNVLHGYVPHRATPAPPAGIPAGAPGNAVRRNIPAEARQVAAQFQELAKAFPAPASAMPRSVLGYTGAAAYGARPPLGPVPQCGLHTSPPRG